VKYNNAYSDYKLAKSGVPQEHTNVLASELLNTEFDIRRLKRIKPLELAL
jgi:hypothetical protein